MRYHLALAILLVISIKSYSQDKISLLSGEHILCRITSIDSGRIEFTYHKNETIINTYIPLERVGVYMYHRKYHNLFYEDYSRKTRVKLDMEMKKFHAMDSIEQLFNSFLYMEGDYQFSGEKIEYRNRNSSAAYFTIDSYIEYNPKDVRFYENHKDFFARIDMNASLSGYYSYATRLERGLLNIYVNGEKDAISIDSKGSYVVSEGISVNYYYNSGFDEVKPLSYSNLMLDISQYPESNKLLKIYRRKNSLRSSLAIAGGLSIMGSFFVGLQFPEESIPAGTSSQSYDRTSVWGISLGLGLIGGAMIIGRSSDSYLIKALQTYNNQY